MNTTIVKTGIIGFLAVFGSNFMIRDKESGLPLSSTEYTIPAETCFGTFINNLKQLDAIIFIPEKNIEMAAGLGLQKYDKEKALLLNTNFLKNLSAYTQVVPMINKNDKCNEEISLNFSQLEMIVYVKNEKVESLEKLNMVKIETHLITLGSAPQMVKLEYRQSVKMEQSGESLNIKWENNQTQRYIPMWKF